MKEAGVAFQPLGNINDTLLEGISRTIQVLENQAMKKNLYCDLFDDTNYGE